MAKLPKELVSLIQHVELNKAGWWDKALENMILSILLIDSTSLTYNQICKRIPQEFGTSPNPERIEAQFEELIKSGTLTSVHPDKYKISEKAEKNLREKIADTQKNEIAARELFCVSLAKYCPDLNATTTWEKFNVQFLFPAIQEFGAEMYSFLVDREASAPSFSYEEFLKNFPKESHDCLREAIKEFFDPKSTIIKTHVFSHLNAHFFVESAGLNNVTLDALSKLNTTQHSFEIFIDTNFLFSFLGIKEDPSNEAAILLINLIQRLSGRVGIKLYVLPETINEFQSVLLGVRSELREVHFSRNLADIAMTMGVEGFMKRVAEHMATTGVTVDEFYEPYLTNTLRMLRDDRIELFNGDLRAYPTRQDVVDDLTDQLAFDKGHHPDKPKNYEALEHDIILWHFVRDRRPQFEESFLEAKTWIVTIDYRFLSFDRFKLKNLNNKLETCLPPTALVQMLQFWLPRTPEFEEALVSSMRSSILFNIFDEQAEQVSTKIIKTLSRYENIGNISHETIISVVSNQGLRSRILPEKNVEKVIELVKEALLEEAEKNRQKLLDAERRERELNEMTGSQSTEIESLEKRVEEANLEIALLKDTVSSTASTLEKRLSEEKHEQRVRNTQAFKEKWIFLLSTLLIVVGACFDFMIHQFLRWSFTLTILGTVIILFIIWSATVHIKIKKFSENINKDDLAWFSKLNNNVIDRVASLIQTIITKHLPW